MQASKQQRKFTVAPHNMSYAAVADLNRHIFVYRQVATATHLRNRKSGQNVDKVAKQVRAHQNHLSRLGRLDVCKFRTRKQPNLAQAYLLPNF